MPADRFTVLEAEAAIVGGGAAFGEALERCGWGHVFDGMPPEVFAEAMKAAVGGYRTHLQRALDEAPF